MKKSDLRKILKPIVKECVKETLLEEGILSSIISEVVRGVSPLVETKTSSQSSKSTTRQKDLLEQQRRELQEEKQRRLKEQKIKLLNATGFGNQIFEGVEPLSQGGNPNSSPQHSSLSGVDPTDQGVDIAGIMAVANRNWKDLV